MTPLYTFTGKIIVLLAFCVLNSNLLLAQHAVAEYNKAVVSYDQGKEKRALRHFKQAFQYDNKHTEAGLALVKMYTTMGKPAKAARYTPNLINLEENADPALAEKNYYQAYLNIKAQQYTQAREQLNRAIKSADHSAASDFELLSRCYNALGYLEVMQQGISRNRRNARQHIKIHERDMEEALKAFRKALQYAADNKAAHANYLAICELLSITPQPIAKIQPTTTVQQGVEVTTSLEPAIPETPVKNLADLRNTDLLINQINQHDEVILVIDISGSMRVPVDKNLPVSRFNAMQNTVLELLQKVDERVHIGVITLGGECGGKPYYSTQAAANNRLMLEELVRELPLDGHTPLNDVLGIVPQLFTGQTPNQAIFLLTDGMASCEPEKTCRTAAQFGNLGIYLHVMSFLVNNAENSEAFSSYECITRNTNGKLMSITAEGTIELEVLQEADILTNEQLILPKIERDNTLKNIDRMYKANVVSSR